MFVLGNRLQVFGQPFGQLPTSFNAGVFLFRLPFPHRLGHCRRHLGKDVFLVEPREHLINDRVDGRFIDWQRRLILVRP